MFRLTWTAWNSFLSQTISDVETKQNAKQFCLVQLEKRRTESWRIYVPLKNQATNLWRKLHCCLLEHFKPKHLVVAESFKFYNANQEESESISNFFVRLKHLASTCEFGSFLKRALHDKFVYGLKDDKMAEAMELATANVGYIKEKETGEINKMCAESNVFELQKKKKVFWERRKMALEMLTVGTIKNIFPDIVKINKGENMSHYIQETHDMLLLSTRYSNYKPYTCKLELNGVQCEMEIDYRVFVDSDKQKTI